jgi:hypothetical protein
MAHSRAHQRGNGKGKGIDRSTLWSEFAWDERGYWFSTRYNSSGELEYERAYPKNTSEPESTPRTLDVERENTEDISGMCSFNNISSLSHANLPEAQPGSNIYVFDSRAVPATGGPDTETAQEFEVEGVALPARDRNYTARSHYYLRGDGYHFQPYTGPLTNETAGSPLDFGPPEIKNIRRVPLSPSVEELDPR